MSIVYYQNLLQCLGAFDSAFQSLCALVIEAHPALGVSKTKKGGQSK